MALFPEATFTVFLPESGVVPGTRLEGTLQVDVPAAIPRADHIQLYYRTHVSIDEGRTGESQDLFVAPLELRLNREQPLPPGKHTFPFAIAIPPWLPPSYTSIDCSIKHRIEVRLDVDWAIDPTAAVTPTVFLPPTEAVAHPVAMRSPRGFHESLVVDLTLDTNVIAEGDEISGQVALRGGHDAKFNGLKISLVSVATVRTTPPDRRRGPGVATRIAAEYLRGGASVPFALRHPKSMPPTFRTGKIDHDVAIIVEAVVPTTWAEASSFDVPIHVVPAGSIIHRRETELAPLGAERLLRLAGSMAQATGLAQGRLPVLVEGRTGPVAIRISDGPRDGRIGIDVALDVADLALGITLRPMGVLDRRSATSLVPSTLAHRYVLTVAPERPVADEAIRAFFTAILGNLDPATDVRLSDRHFGLRLRMRNDGAEDVVQCARWAKERAEILAAAISRLPFAPAFDTAAPAWAALAAEQGAYLFPHVPAIHGIKVGMRIASGEHRELGVVLRARPDGTVSADLDLRAAPLPGGANQDGLHVVRAVFPRFSTSAPERVSLEGATFPPVPALLIGTLETFLAWLLDVRGERRSDGPYR